MKKLIPFISPLVVGMLGGLFVECTMCILSAVVSPFFDSAHAPHLAFLIVTAILSALLIIAMVVVNVVYLIKLNDKSKIKITVILEVLVGIAAFFISWNFGDLMVSGLYSLF